MKQLVSILLVMALATACGSILPTPTLTPTATPLPPTNTLTAVPTATRVPPTNTPQPTATNTPTPTPVVLNGTVRNNANVRDLPSDKAKILGTLQRNAQLTLVGRNNDSTWFQIPFPLAGSPERGWVLANLISTTINLSSTLPVIVPITPTVTASPTKGTVVATATISGTPPTVTPRPTTTSTPTSSHPRVWMASQRRRGRNGSRDRQDVCSATDRRDACPTGRKAGGCVGAQRSE